MTMHFKGLAALALAGSMLAGCAAPGGDMWNRNVLIRNESGEAFREFYGSRATTDSWEENILGSSTVPNGEEVMIDFDDGTGECIFDLQAVTMSGREIEEYGIDICTATSVTFR